VPFPQLSEGELISLFIAERMPQQSRGTPFEPDPPRATIRLNEMLPGGVSVRLDHIADILSVLPATEMPTTRPLLPDILDGLPTVRRMPEEG
jgi:hypothetical protein